MRHLPANHGKGRQTTHRCGSTYCIDLSDVFLKLSRCRTKKISPRTNSSRPEERLLDFSLSDIYSAQR